MAEPMAPTPPRRRCRAIVKNEKWGSSPKLQYNTYVFLRRGGRNNPQPRVVRCARDYDRPHGRCTIDNIVAGVGDHRANQYPAGRPNDLQADITLSTLKGWIPKQKSMATPVQIRTGSTNSYREAEYPYSCVSVLMGRAGLGGGRARPGPHICVFIISVDVLYPYYLTPIVRRGKINTFLAKVTTISYQTFKPS